MLPGSPYSPKAAFAGAFVPEWLQAYDGVSAGAKLTYSTMASRADGSRIRVMQVELAKLCGCTDRSIRNHIIELEAAGMLRVINDGAVGDVNEYEFLWPSWAESAMTVSSEAQVQNSSEETFSSGDYHTDTPPLKGGVSCEGKKDSLTVSSVDSFLPEVRAVVEHLNSVVGSRFTVAGSRRFIAPRLAEGRTVETLKRVIDTKAAEWLSDPKMRKYLRPETLFNKTKCESYVGLLDLDQDESIGGGWQELG